jgi:hypothetical protein
MQYGFDDTSMATALCAVCMGSSRGQSDVEGYELHEIAETTDQCIAFSDILRQHGILDALADDNNADATVRITYGVGLGDGGTLFCMTSVDVSKALEDMQVIRMGDATGQYVKSGKRKRKRTARSRCFQPWSRICG